MRQLTRRQSLGAAAAALAAMSGARRPASAAQFEYKLGHNNPVDHPVHVRLVEFASNVLKETNGRLNVTLFPHSQLGSQTAQVTQLRSGSIQFYINLNAVWSDVVPIAAIDSIGFAFTSRPQAAQVMDGALGAYVRKEFESRGMYVFEKVFDNGMRQVTSSLRPIKTVDDFTNFKIRTPASKSSLDLFRTLGASPTPLSSNEVYTGLQTKLIDGQEMPLVSIETEHLYEVQKFLSMTSHQWAGFWWAANMDAWMALPPDIRAVVDRNAAKCVLAERNDQRLVDAACSDKLHRQGLAFNTPDTKEMRARLAPYYARWKAEFGPTAWGLLEAGVGKLG